MSYIWTSNYTEGLMPDVDQLKRRDFLTALSLSAIPALLSGGALGAIISQFFGRGKTLAEERKIDAEAENLKAQTAKTLRELNIRGPQQLERSVGREPKGWFKAGDNPDGYDISIDQNEIFHGKPSCYIKSRESARSFGTL